jgi:leucyl/phenylalanyl-tRNA--protein transferase
MSAKFGPEALLDCYRRGVFPMAEARGDDRLFLVDPHERGVLPLDRFHVPTRLARTVRADVFQVTVNRDFEGVMRLCAAPTPERPETWINDQILSLYVGLHRRGQAHSVECRKDDELVGGLYGVALGAAFFGESMFSRVRDASKVALVHLVARLRVGGFTLLDTQFHTAHLGQFGCEVISRGAFKRRLSAALEARGDFLSMVPDAPGAYVLQSITQTS